MLAYVAVLTVVVAAPPSGHWLEVGAQTSFVTSVVGQASTGAEGSLFLTLPQVRPREDETGDLVGWRVQLGAQLGAERIGDRFCGDARLCALRLFAGPTLRAGWLRGQLTEATGLFTQLDVLAAHADAPSAPLSPGIDRFELLVRARLGAQWAPRTAQRTGITFFAAVMVETSPLPGVTQGVGAGFTLGLGL